MAVSARFAKWGLGLFISGVFLTFGIIGHYCAGAVHAQTTPQVPYTARAFSSANAGLARSAGVPARLAFDSEAIAKNVVYPAGGTADMIAADPDVTRPQWVVPEWFWEEPLPRGGNARGR